MNDKTKRIILITACCLLCGVAVIGIAGRFGGNTVTPSGTVSGSQPDSNDPNVNINNSPAVRQHYRMTTKRRMCRTRNARRRMNRIPHIRNSPPPSLRNPSPPQEARTPPVRYMCRASAM